VTFIVFFLNIDVSSESTVTYESKDISQTSLLTTVSTVPPEFYPTQKSAIAENISHLGNKKI